MKSRGVERALGRWRCLPAAARRLFAGRRVEIVLVDDRAIACLAGRYRASPRPTDVLAFCYDAPDLAGEVAISLPTAQRQARERGVPLAHELILLGVHGLLHIGGFDDEAPRCWREMKRAEFEMMMKILY